MCDSSSQRVGEWGGVMSVERDCVAGQVFNRIEWERCFYNNDHVLRQRCGRRFTVDATVEDSCEDANMYYME